MGIEEYEFIRVVGKGSFGKVYLVKHRKERKHFCLKVIKLEGISDEERNACTHEVSLMQQMFHPNIVGFKESFFSRGGKELCIVMTYCDGGDMEERVKRQGSKPFRETQILHWFVQIALGLQFMHDKRVLHRDLKTQNLFLLGNGRLVLGDLGISKVLERHNDFARTAIGTPYYMSPELFRNKPYNHKSDVWALGCILYELATLKHAFDANSINGLASKITKGVFTPIPSSFSKDLRVLIKSMLSLNPSKRPSLPEILKRPFIKRHVYYFLREILQRPSSKIGDGTMVFKAAALNVGNEASWMKPPGSQNNSLQSQQARNLKLQLQKLGMRDCVEHALAPTDGDGSSPINSVRRSSPFVAQVAGKRVGSPVQSIASKQSEDARGRRHRAARKAAKEQKDALIRERERRQAVENALEKLRKERELRLKERMERAEKRRLQARQEDERKRKRAQERRYNAQKRAQERVREYRQKQQFNEDDSSTQENLVAKREKSLLQPADHDIEIERQRVAELDAWADAWQAKEARAKAFVQRRGEQQENDRRFTGVGLDPPRDPIKPRLQQNQPTLDHENVDALEVSAHEYAAERNPKKQDLEKQSFHSDSFDESDDETTTDNVPSVQVPRMHPQSGPVKRSPIHAMQSSGVNGARKKAWQKWPSSHAGDQANVSEHESQKHPPQEIVESVLSQPLPGTNHNAPSWHSTPGQKQLSNRQHNMSEQDWSDEVPALLVRHAESVRAAAQLSNLSVEPNKVVSENVKLGSAPNEPRNSASKSDAEDDAEESDSELMPMVESDDDIDDREEELKAELAFARSRCKELNQTLKKARVVLGTSSPNRPGDCDFQVDHKDDLATMEGCQTTGVEGEDCDDDGDDFDDVCDDGEADDDEDEQVENEVPDTPVAHNGNVDDRDDTTELVDVEDGDWDAPQEVRNNHEASKRTKYQESDSNNLIAKTIAILESSPTAPDPLEVSTDSMETGSEGDFVSPIGETMGYDDLWVSPGSTMPLSSAPSHVTPPPIVLGGKGLKGRILNLKHQCQSALGEERFNEVYTILKTILEGKLKTNGPNIQQESELEKKLNSLLQPDMLLYRNKVDNLIFMEETQR